MKGTGILEAGIRLAETLGLRQTVVRGLLNLGVSLLARDPRGSFERSNAAFDHGRAGSGSGTATRSHSPMHPRCAVDLGEWDWALCGHGRAQRRAAGSGGPCKPSCVVARRSWPLEACRSMTCSPSTSASLSTARTPSTSPTCWRAGPPRHSPLDGIARPPPLATGPREFNFTNTAMDLPARRARLALGGRSRGCSSDAHRRSMPRHSTVASLTSNGEPSGPPSARTTAIASLPPASTPRSFPSSPIWASPTSRRSWSSTWCSCWGPKHPVVQASVDDARSILERLDARALLARLEELIGEAVDSRSARIVR